MSPAHALRVAGKARNQTDDEINAHIEAFYDAFRAANPVEARKMLDNPTGWKQ